MPIKLSVHIKVTAMSRLGKNKYKADLACGHSIILIHDRPYKTLLCPDNCICDYSDQDNLKYIKRRKIV